MDLFTKLRKMHLLLIDDDEWVRESLRLFFESEGCPIVALETAEEGLNCAASRHFDIIVVDYRLPGMDGLEFINRLPVSQAETVKVLITAYGSDDLFIKARQSGFHACIPKPFTIEIIEQSLEHLIGQTDYRRLKTMRLTQILSTEKWEQFEKALFDRFHINCTVYDVSGKGVTGKPHWCNRLCPEIKANKDSLVAICASGNQYFMAQAKQTRKAVIDECDAGLTKIAVPIFVDGEFLGTAGGCGLLPAGGEVQTFLLEKTMGLSESQILELCEGLGTMTQAEAQKVAVYIEKRAAQFVDDYLKMDS